MQVQANRCNPKRIYAASVVAMSATGETKTTAKLIEKAYASLSKSNHIDTSLVATTVNGKQPAHIPSSKSRQVQANLGTPRQV